MKMCVLLGRFSQSSIRHNPVIIVAVTNASQLARSSQGEIISDNLLAHVAPLGWENITFNGDYIGPQTPSKTTSGHCGIRAQHSSMPLSVRFRTDSAMTPLHGQSKFSPAILSDEARDVGRLSRRRYSCTRGRPWVRVTSGETRHKVALWFDGGH